MSSRKVYLAVDLGAESGRVVAGILNHGVLSLEEIHRFPNRPIELPGRQYWNIVGLHNRILEGIQKSVQKFGKDIVSVGVDTWGVDYGLLDENNEPLGMVYQYRDSRTDGVADSLGQTMPAREIYQHTGIRPLFYNTLTQLVAAQRQNNAPLRVAKKLLFVPDLLNYFLTGQAFVERTIASTGQLLDPRTGQWAWPVIDAFGLPRDLFGQVIEPGTTIGTLQPYCAARVGASLKVVAVGAHDTASAVAGVPADKGHWAFLSSGTWSIMGIESQTPVITDRSWELGFVNEGGISGTTRVLKNISGLWIVQELRREWQAQGKLYDYTIMTEMAAQAEPLRSFINPTSPEFAKGGDMSKKIKDFCKRTGQDVPKEHGAILRCALESLALAYAVVFRDLEELRGKRIETLHIVGGGTQNNLLNHMAANAVQRDVVIGPIEATCAGNVLVQLMADGTVASLAEGRTILRSSFPVKTIHPTDKSAWDEALLRFRKLV